MNVLASPYAIALTGLQAATTRLAVSAHNTANVNTERFEPSAVQANDLSSGGVEVSISAAARARSRADGKEASIWSVSRTDLTEEALSQTLSRVAFLANVKTVRSAESLDATLMSLGLPSEARSSEE